MEQPIFLVGYMCSGKSTLGRALAAELEVDFVDIDDSIEEREGRSVSRIFADEGEAYFRRVESEMLGEVIERYSNRRAVIALGGGTPCRDGVMDRLNKAGMTVHLAVDVPRLVERLIDGAAKRPLVAGKTPEQLTAFVSQMLAERNPYYSKAQYRFDSSLLENDAQVADTVSRFVAELL